jgi:NitT/TauT family transport system substrate-binding protein
VERMVKFKMASAGLVLLLAAACGSSSGQSAPPKALGHLTVGLTYIPNIQFAPFYVADSLGYFKDAGVTVTLRHHTFSEDEFGAIGSGQEDVVFAGGDEMFQARAHNLALVDVATVYRKYPVALMIPSDSSIRSAADLRGHTIGTPGPYGETYFGLLALLQSAGLKQSDLNVQYIQFTQVAALLGHKADGVMGYLNNESIQFQQANFGVRTLALSDVIHPLPLVSNGLGATSAELKAHGPEVKAAVAAMLRGVQYSIAHPQETLDISKKYVPGLDDPKKAADALAVLKATIPLWQPNGKLGANDPEAWRGMADFMLAYNLVPSKMSPTDAYSNNYLP